MNTEVATTMAPFVEAATAQTPPLPGVPHVFDVFAPDAAVTRRALAAI